MNHLWAAVAATAAFAVPCIAVAQDDGISQFEAFCATPDSDLQGAMDRALRAGFSPPTKDIAARMPAILPNIQNQRVALRETTKLPTFIVTGSAPFDPVPGTTADICSIGQRAVDATAEDELKRWLGVPLIQMGPQAFFVFRQTSAGRVAVSQDASEEDLVRFSKSGELRLVATQSDDQQTVFIFIRIKLADHPAP